MLRGERIILGPLGDDDSETLFRWINEREDVLLSAPYRPVHGDDHAAWFARVREGGDAVAFAIRTREDDRLIGSCQLHSIDSVSRSAELRIRIGESDARGRGFGVEAVGLLVRHGFDDLNLHRIWLRVLATNERALETYRRAGFVEEGRLRDAAFVDGDYVDVVVMARLRDASA